MGCSQVRGRQSAGNELDIERSGSYGCRYNSDRSGFLAYGSRDLESHDPLAMCPRQSRRRQDFRRVTGALGSKQFSVA